MPIRKKRGLAAASKATRRRVARIGAKASQKSPNRYCFTHEQRAKGGRASNFGSRPKADVIAAARKGGLTKRKRNETNKTAKRRT